MQMSSVRLSNSKLGFSGREIFALARVAVLLRSTYERRLNSNQHLVSSKISILRYCIFILCIFDYLLVCNINFWRVDCVDATIDNRFQEYFIY